MRLASSELRFARLTAVGLIAVLVTYRLAHGVGFGWLDPSSPDRVDSGIVLNAHDNLQYVSWARQAAEGRFLLENLYTTEPHRPAAVLPVLWLVGQVARVVAVPPLAVIVILGLAAAGLVVLLSYRIARAVGLTVGEARAATLLVAFASGVTWPLVPVAEALIREPIPMRGADVSYFDALFFSSALVYPYIQIAYALLCAAVLLTLRADRGDLPRPVRRRALVGAALAVLVLASTHPYEYLALVTTFALLTVISVRDPRIDTRSRWRIAGVLCAAGIVPFAYHLHVAHLPVWEDAVAQSLALPRDRATWILGWGTPLAFAVVGAVVVFRSARLEAARWFALWLGGLLFLLVGLAVTRTKVSAGGHLPICLLAAPGWFAAWHWAGEWRVAWRRRAMLTGLAAVVVLAISGSVRLLGELGGSHPRWDRDLLAALEGLPQNRERPPVVLCDFDTGTLLPALAGARVYAGNVFLTPRAAEKRSELRELGVVRTRTQAADVAADARDRLEALLLNEGIEFVLLDAASPANAFASELDGCEEVASEGDWRLYRVDRGAGAVAGVDG